MEEKYDEEKNSIINGNCNGSIDAGRLREERGGNDNIDPLALIWDDDVLDFLRICCYVSFFFSDFVN